MDKVEPRYRLQKDLYRRDTKNCPAFAGNTVHTGTHHPERPIKSTTGQNKAPDEDAKIGPKKGTNRRLRLVNPITQHGSRRSENSHDEIPDKRSAITDGQIIWYNSNPDENITPYMPAWHAAHHPTRSEMMTHKVPHHRHITSHYITQSQEPDTVALTKGTSPIQWQ